MFFQIICLSSRFIRVGIELAEVSISMAMFHRQPSLSLYVHTKSIPVHASGCGMV